MRLFFFPVSYILLAITIIISTTLQAGLGSISGHVALGGEVVESACAISPEHLEQHIMLNNISPDRLVRGDGGELHPFSIDLINCNPQRQNPAHESWLGFQITFEGRADGNNFELQGESQGLALEIQDDRGFIARPGIAMPSHPVPVGERKLNYNLRLIGNQKLMKAGRHFAVLKYKLDYY
ncbi:fimbrial protein [Acinetobacter vivianii]|uniref:Fimbrial protein n=1 Tax=Acinetobacter vivianii TaxID=1776742 RepID=A0AAJ6NJW2_9GAMM|nr:fimbrial protein [Acinetobacter vivianii]WDZ51808.1 fimbrial protein [Acinetobacter vivianii]